jgi:hypothetical protein
MSYENGVTVYVPDIAAAVGRLADNLDDAFTAAQRAVDLASQIGDRRRIDAARAALLGLHAEVMQEAHDYQWTRAFDHLVGHRKARTTPTEMAALVADLEIVLARVSDSAKPETFDPHAATDAAQRLARHYTRKGMPAEVKRVRGVSGRSFEFAAGQANPALATSFLQNSLDAYMQAGLPDEVERMRIAMQQAVRNSRDEMTQYRMPIEISKDAMDKAIAGVAANDVEQTFSTIAMAFVPGSKTLKLRFPISPRTHRCWL